MLNGRLLEVDDEDSISSSLSYEEEEEKLYPKSANKVAAAHSDAEKANTVNEIERKVLHFQR